MEQLQTVIEYFDLANGSRAEPQLNEQDFRQFHAEVDRIRQAFLYISSSNLRNGELMRNRLRSILFRAMHKMELLFRKHLSSCSQPTAAGEDGTVDILKLNFPPWPVSSQPQELASPVLAASTSEVSATPLIDAKQIETLRNIAQYLAQNELDMAAHGELEYR
jgi:hypothetical protein